MKKFLVTEQFIKDRLKSGDSVIKVSSPFVVTPLASDYIKQHSIILSTGNVENSPQFIYNSDQVRKKIFIGSDHAGYKLKTYLFKKLQGLGYEVVDNGTYDANPVDYPDFAKKVAISVLSNPNSVGICVDATGSPSSITTNKFKGIRAAVLYNEFSAKSSVEHNNSNICCLGAATLGELLALSLVEIWLNSSFLGDRHAKRLEKISKIEENNFK